MAADRRTTDAPFRSGCRIPGAAGAGSARALPAGRAHAVASAASGIHRPSGAVGRRASPATVGAKECPSGVPAEPGIRVVEPGLLATLQDLGRPGAGSLGIASSGALDRAALRTANRLLGNPEGAAGIEVTMGGLRAIADATSGSPSPGMGADPPRRTRGRSVRGAPLAARERSSTSTGSRTAPAATSPSAAGSRRARCSVRGRPTCWRGSGPAPLRAGDVVACGTTPPRRSPSPRSRRGARRTTTSSMVELAPGRAATGSRHPPSHPVRDRLDRLERRRPHRRAPRRAGLERAREGELPSEGHGPGRDPGAAERAPDDPPRGRAGDRRLPRHRGGDGCRARPARPGPAGYPHPVPPRSPDLGPRPRLPAVRPLRAMRVLRAFPASPWSRHRRPRGSYSVPRSSAARSLAATSAA